MNTTEMNGQKKQEAVSITSETTLQVGEWMRKPMSEMNEQELEFFGEKLKELKIIVAERIVELTRNAEEHNQSSCSKEKN